MEHWSWLIAQQLLTTGAGDLIAEIALKALFPVIGAALLWSARKLPEAVREIKEMSARLKEHDLKVEGINTRLGEIEASFRNRCEAVERSNQSAVAMAKETLLGEVRQTNHQLANVRTVVAVSEERMHSIEMRLADVQKRMAE